MSIDSFINKVDFFVEKQIENIGYGDSSHISERISRLFEKHESVATKISYTEYINFWDNQISHSPYTYICSLIEKIKFILMSDPSVFELNEIQKGNYAAVCS